jgi:hypothetical protein
MKIKNTIMKIKTFKHGYRNGWEINFIGKKYNIRIARYQFGLWKDYNPIINWTWQ